MKVQFMKKLVPLALITSIAVTNVGITSVAAQTPTNAITQSVEGPVAVENESVSVGETATAVTITAAQATAVTFASAVDKDVTFYSPYGAEKKVDDAATASVEIENTIKADSNNGGYVEPYANYVGKDKAFYLASDSAGTTKVAGSNVEIFVAGQGDNPGKVTFRVTVNYGSIKDDEGNAKSLYLFADTGAKTKIAELSLTAKVETTNIVSYEENAKGIVAKYRIVQTNSKTTDAPAKYALYKQTATTNPTTGEVTYAPTDAKIEAANGTGAGLSDIAAGYIRDLTAEELAALPYTTAKAATEAEYLALEGTDNINGKTKQNYLDAVDKAQVEYIKKIVGDYKAGPGEGTTPSENFTKAVTALTGLIDGMQTQVKKDAVKAAAKTTVAAAESDHVIKLGTTEIPNLKWKDDLENKIDLAKKALFVTNMETVLSPDKGVLATRQKYADWKEAEIAKDAGADVSDLAYLKAFDASKTAFYSGASLEVFLDESLSPSTGSGSRTPWKLITDDDNYKNALKELSWEDSSDASIKEAMKYASINEFIKSVNTAGNDLDSVLPTGSKEYFEDSTAWTAKIADLKKELLEGDYAHKSVLDVDAINWITETVNAKGDLASGAAFAKFAVTKNDKTSFAAKTTGDSVIVGATKANKQTNSYVIVKAVSKNYKAATAKTAQKGDVYAQAEFYVTPVASTGFTEKSLSTTAEKPGITFSAPASTATDPTDKKTYTLKLDEGKSYKLPFALKDGADKTLVYDVTGTGFTVVNGTVKAIAGDCQGDIIVRPAATPNAWTDELGVDKPENATALKVHVETNTTVKQIKANANNVTMYPGATQYISFGTNPASFGTYTYEITGVEGYKSATFVKDLAGNVDGSDAKNNTILKLEAYSASEIAADETKQPAKTVKATVKIKKGTDEVDVKEFPLTIKWAGAGANAKTVKETYKKVNSDGVVEINVPVGGVVNLGASVNPATADQSIKYIAAKDVAGTTDPTKVTSGVATLNTVTNGWNATFADDGSDETKKYQSATNVTGITMNGDVVKAVTAGTYYVKGWTAAKNEKGENLTTNIYKINVYTPGASIIMNDLRDDAKGFAYEDANGDNGTAERATKDSVYTIVGGNLMSKAAADTDGNKTIMGGQTITIAEPYTLGTSEEIEWKCNKPSAIRITKGKEYNRVATRDGSDNATAFETDNLPTLNLDLMQAGTFTITGTTKYTKQKFVFKVNVGADATIKRDQTPTCEKFYFDYNGTAVDLLNSGSPVADGATKMKVKDTASVGFFTNKVGLNGTVKYEAVDKKVLNVAANGTVKALAKGSTAIKATFTSADKKTTFTVTSPKITVEPQKATISKFTIPSGVSIGKDFNVSAAIKDAKIADCDVKWEYKKYDDKAAFDTAITNNASGADAAAKAVTDGSSWSLGNKPSGKVKLTEKGVYLVKLTVSPKGDNNAANKVVAWGEVEAFEKTPTIVNVNNNDADAKKAIAALAAAPKAGEEEGTTVGGAGYGVYIIPVFATDKDGAVVDAADIEWTSSNVSLATAEAVTIAQNQSVKDFLNTANSTDTTANGFAAAVEEENAIVKSAADAYGLVKIVTASANSGLTGKVTLTGVLKNSGKKVTVTLNIKNEAKKVVDPYAPITRSGDTMTNVQFKNIQTLKGDKFNAEDVNKLAKGKTYTYYDYVLVDTTDAKLLKAKPADHIVVKNDIPASAVQPIAFKIATTVAESGVTVDSLDSTGIATGKTYYLAQVAITVKVKEAAKYDDNDTKTADAVIDTTPTKQVVTIASNTPFIVTSNS